jgi:hypothetical protein
MRIAVHATGTIATRAFRMLLAEADVEMVGIVDRSPSTNDIRVRRAGDLSGYDVVVSDGEEPAEMARRAEAAGISCVLWRDDPVPWGSTRTLVRGANLGSGIAPALASHEAAVVGDAPRLTIAWTEPGRPLRQGVAAPFPDPVGSLWSEERTNGGRIRMLAAPVQGDWAGALVIVGDPERPDRIVGVADDARHLEAIALAAATAAVGRGRYPEGAVTVDAAAEDFLLLAISMGLEVAGFTAR